MDCFFIALIPPGNRFHKKLNRQKLIILELLNEFSFYKATVKFEIKLLISKNKTYSMQSAASNFTTLYTPLLVTPLIRTDQLCFS